MEERTWSTLPRLHGSDIKRQHRVCTAVKMKPTEDKLGKDNSGGRKRTLGEDFAWKRKGGKVEGEKEGKKTKKIETTTVFFVDSTKGGILAKRLRAEEDRLASLTGFRVKIVESGGSQLR